MLRSKRRSDDYDHDFELDSLEGILYFFPFVKDQTLTLETSKEKRTVLFFLASVYIEIHIHFSGIFCTFITDVHFMEEGVKLKFEF